MLSVGGVSMSSLSEGGVGSISSEWPGESAGDSSDSGVASSGHEVTGRASLMVYRSVDEELNSGTCSFGGDDTSWPHPVSASRVSQRLTVCIVIFTVFPPQDSLGSS